MSNEKGIHDGHKGRLRDKFCKYENFYVFEDHEKIEMVLNYADVRRNQNETAHNLIKRFGSIKGIFDAERQELEEVPGVGKSIATYILMLRQLIAEYNRDVSRVENMYVPQTDLMEYIKSLFDGTDKEILYMLCVCKDGKIPQNHIIGTGTKTSVLLDQREIIKIALNTNAVGVMFAHNHPFGSAMASEEDVRNTKEMEKILSKLQIKLIDHFVVAEDKCISILEDPRYKYYK